MTVVVTTPTGQIGHRVAAGLVQRGERVRVIARRPAALDAGLVDRVEVIVGSHADAGVVESALDGASAILVVVPPGLDGVDARSRYLTFARPIAEALRSAPPVQVVTISSAGHRWTQDAGVLSAAFAADSLLAEVGVPLRILCMPWFMENLLTQVDAIAESGCLTLPFEHNRPLASVATADIAVAAEALLADRTWTGYKEIPVFGPDLLTPTAMAQTIATTIDSPVRYRQSTIAAVGARMSESGVTAETVRDYVAMVTAVNNGIYDAEAAELRNTGTSFETWCGNVLRPALERR